MDFTGERVIPNAYITKNAVFIGGEKVPGLFLDDPVVLPRKEGNLITLTFIVSNVVVEGDVE